jgi:flagellar FliL protein
MSDQLFDTEEEVASEESSTGGRRVGFLPGMLIQILKWAGIIIGAIIFIVTVVVLTLNFMGAGTDTAQTQIPEGTEEYESDVPVLSWYSNISEIRGSTADQPRQTFIVAPHIGYRPGQQQVENELINRKIQIREIMAVYFSSRTADELLGAENRERVKQELKRRINDIMTSGQVADIAFDRYQIVEF